MPRKKDSEPTPAPPPPPAKRHDDAPHAGAHADRHAPNHANASHGAAKAGPEVPPAALLESVPYPLFAKDTDGRYLYANVQYCALVGSALDAILGRTDRDLFPRDKAERLHAEDHRVLETGGPVDTRDETRRSDGSTQALRGTKAPLRGPHG
jgi:PAS domain S-box-containing protein